jgi:hypothetical protein
MRLLVPVAVAGVMLTGCADVKELKPESTPSATAPADNGIKDLSAAEIVNRAATATDAAGSYRVKGEVTHQGQRLFADVVIKNKDISGTATTTQGTLKLVRVGSELYVQADPALWKLFLTDGAEMFAPLLQGKWIKTSTTGQMWSEFATIGDVSQMVKKYGTSTITKGELKTVNGQRVVELKEKSGVLIYVAATGQPYIVRVEMPGEGHLDVSDFGAKLDDVKAPPKEQVIDLSALLGR